MTSLLRSNWRLLLRNRGLVTWLGLMMLRRRAKNGVGFAVRGALVLTVIGALAALGWWWLHRDTGGEDWRRMPEPDPTPAPPPPVPEPAVPVGV